MILRCFVCCDQAILFLSPAVDPLFVPVRDPPPAPHVISLPPRVCFIQTIVGAFSQLSFQGASFDLADRPEVKFPRRHDAGIFLKTWAKNYELSSFFKRNPEPVPSFSSLLVPLLLSNLVFFLSLTTNTAISSARPLHRPDGSLYSISFS